MEQDLKTFQLSNCLGCRFADKKKIGTGEPCCNKAAPYRVEDTTGWCIDRRHEEVK